MQSKRLYPSVSGAAHDRLAECAVEHDVVKEDETPNVSRFANQILLFFLTLDRMDGMGQLKSEDGSTTMDVIRRATYQSVNNKDDPEDDAAHENRHLN